MNRGTVRFRSDVQNLFHSPGDGAISGERGCMQGCPPPPPPLRPRLCGGVGTPPEFCVPHRVAVCAIHAWRFLSRGGWSLGESSLHRRTWEPRPPSVPHVPPRVTAVPFRREYSQKTSRRQREVSEKAGWACGFLIVQEHKQRLISLLLLLILQLPFVWALSDGFRGRPPPPCCMEDHQPSEHGWPPRSFVGEPMTTSASTLQVIS